MTNNPLARLSVQQLKQAVTIREKIDTLRKELDRIVGNQASKDAAPRKRAKLSAAGRARISAAAKARWAKIKARRTKK